MTFVDELRASVTGPVLIPGEPGYSEEVAGFNRAATPAPDVVVGIASASDASEAVRCAAAHGLPVRVQATGHGSHHTVSGGMLLSTRRLGEVTVDADSHIASVGAGATWRDVQAAATPLGLSTIPGSSMTVGAVGYTLGGGLGPLARSHGFTSDYVRGFELVNASGELLTANDTENPELFWALRGGKGGLGVVTRMHIELVACESIYAGSLFVAEGDIEATLRGWIEWTHTAPHDVTTSVAVLNLPDVDVIPEPIRGARVLSLRFAFPGDEAEGARLAAPLRALAPPVIDTIGVLPMADLGLIHNDPDQPGPAWSRGLLLRDLDQEFATELLTHIGPGRAAPLITTEIRHLGAATTCDVAGGSAVGGRASEATLTMVGVPDPSLFETELPAFTDSLIGDISTWDSGETTINFAGSPTTESELANAWPAPIHERLQAVRGMNDPDRLFTYGPGGG